MPPQLREEKKYKHKGITDRTMETVQQMQTGAKLSPPKFLTEGAKKEWRRIIRLYKDLTPQILNDLDIGVLTSYCMEVDIRDRLYRQWSEEQQCELLTEVRNNQASQDLTANGEVLRQHTKLTKGKEVNPLLTQISKHNQQIARLGEQLCLSPVGRASYAIKKEKQQRNSVEEMIDFFEEDGTSGLLN